MDIAKVYDWFANESLRAAEETDQPREREILLKLALQWAAAAQVSRNEAVTQQSTTQLPEKETTGLWNGAPS